MKKILTSFLATATIALAQTYNESGGLVVMEMENTPSSLGLWQQQSSLSGYSGSGYLQFLGNTFETGPATSPLEFNFKINQAGLYYLHLHCAKETHDGRTDVANDCYVRVEGNYNAGPPPYTSHGDNASLALLQSNTKYFGGATNSWKWENGQNSSGGNGNLDPGGESNKRVAVYDFKAGETYKLVVSGRSKFFRLNRIVFRHTSTAQSAAQNLSTPESSLVSTGSSYTYDATTDFPNITGGAVPYYVDNANDALAIAANIEANRTGFARASRTFDGATGTYDVTITTMTEEDGESTYRLLVNGVQVATYSNPFVFVQQGNSPLDLQPHTHTWNGISIPNGATLAIESNADTNGEIPENGGTAWARGRWQQIALTTSTSLIRPPAGRLAYVADGNSPDPDDIGANAVVFGLLGSAGLQDRLVHFSHSCDLNPLAPGSQNIDATNELRRQNYLQQTAGEGIGFFGPFPNLTDYYNCRTEQAAAVNDLKNGINASSVGDPLWIIEAGEPDIIGYALQAANAAARQHVHIISHHPANDNSGDFFTWAQILAFGVTEHQIGDQNVGLQVLISTGLWDWAGTHPDPRMGWILDQLKYAEADGVVAFQNNKYDCSDAGMLYWWITGGSAGGNANATPVEIKDLLLYVPDAEIEILAGWDTWSSESAPVASVLADDITASAVTTADQLVWNTVDERGASDDGTWGSHDGEPSASSGVVDGENLTLPNAASGGSLTFTITNNRTEAVVLDAFRFDAYAFRPKAARTYALSVLAGGGITAGNVFTSGDDAITSVNGANANSAHDDIDIPLGGLADHVLAPGESAQLQLVFSGGDGDGSGGHHLFLDNVAITHAVAPPSPPGGPEVSALILINADTDQDLGPIHNGDTINLTAIGTSNLNVRAETSPASVGSVIFGLDGNPTYQTESIAPYALAGDAVGDYNAWTPALGNHTLTATPYSAAAGGGTAGTPLTVNFTVVSGPAGPVTITGELKKWHKVTFSWTGPSTSETAGTNPFSDYRLNVTFNHAGSGKSYVVPGYFAADGNAAESSAQSGNIWRVNFSPDEVGEWSYVASFRSGTDIAIDSAAGSSAGFFDGDGGSFEIAATDKTGLDLRGKGRLQYVGKHHLRFAETGEYFLKAGPDAPENFLAYEDFDDTPNDSDNQPNLRKSWSPHAGDYHAASASQFTWQGGKGTEILGAVRYLSQKGVNVFSFLTFSLDGDDDNVFPHRLRSNVAAYEGVADNARWGNANGVDKDRFDVSKMDQWERVFEYATQQGLYLHFKTQETENDQKMDGGALGRERQLYYRELVARFGHHLAMNWNLGEENTNTTAQQQAFAQWFRDNAPYRHNVVLHTYPLQKNTVYTPLLGAASKLTGLSMQGNQADFSDVFPDTLTWVQNSAAAGVPWVVAYDEPGDAQHALRPAGDEGNSWTDGRKNALWGNVMAGGAGVEFYFGYQHAESDLTLQNFRSRDGFWDYCRHMLEFFQNNDVPFQDMSNEGALVSNANAWCLRKPGESYVVYLKNGGTTNLNLGAATGDFDVRWFDPRNGGALQQGSVTSVSGGGNVALGNAPAASSSDWVVLVSNASDTPPTNSGVMPGLNSDADVRSDGVIVNLVEGNLVPGRSGSSGGIDRSSILVFQLPDLGNVENPFLSAILGFNVETVSTSPPNVDLYGLGKRMTAEVEAGDYYGETSTPDPTDATLIQSNILNGSTGIGFKSSSESRALTAYLNAQYDGGAGIARYVFLRLSTNAPISGLQRHFVTSADAVGSNGPRITYTAKAKLDFDHWLTSFSFPPGADLTPEGDPDGDGQDTRFEYLFGLDPSDPGSINPFTALPEPVGGTFRYTRRNPVLTGFADYQVWRTEDLSNWFRDDAATQTPDGNGEIQEVTVTLSSLPPSAERLFVQMRAN